ncbi:MAG: hypothetical protein EBU90_06750 [Proteobacteria bacterium]|nr:hypothetical protein [Pseudomonadota bacterium]NBP15007.1 hypothetical protein [bacterium]
METFRDISPQEAQLIALQFMGQAVSGEMKELDKNIVNRTNQLQGTNLNVKNILSSIGSIQQPASPPPAMNSQPQVVNLPVAAPVPHFTPTTVNSDILNKISSQLDTIIKLLDK